MKAFLRKAPEQLAKLHHNIPIPTVKPGHVLVKNEYSGINFIDLYYRDGLYPLPENTILGAEAGGTVVQCLDGDKDRWQNRRVVFFSMGGFAEYSCVPIDKLIPVPDDVPIPTALALTIMGLTAHYLCLSTARLTKNSQVLVHAAGSGTGHMVAQVASNVIGAKVSGTCSTAKLSNIPLPRSNVIDYSGLPDTLPATLKQMTTDNRGFDVVFDGVGKNTWGLSLDVCRPRGLVVFYGNASGPVPPIDPLTLSSRGSLFITRPRLNDYVTTHEELLSRSADVFEWLRSSKLKVVLDREFSGLESTNDALEYVKQGSAKGKVVIKLSRN